MMDGFRCKILLLLSLIILILIIIILQKFFIFIHLLSWFGLVCCVYPPSVFCLRDAFFLFLLFGNMIFTLTQKTFVKKMALISQIWGNLLYFHV